MSERLSAYSALLAVLLIGQAAATARSQPAGQSAAIPQAEESRVATVRPSTLAFLIEELAGQTFRVRNARVVGVFNPRVFLIESATSFPAMMGMRDRIVVLLGGGGALRVAPDALVSSPVTVIGVARTLLGIQVTREVPWPPELTREAVKRLEVRAAVLASSVQTAEGVELTDRSPSSRTQPSSSLVPRFPDGEAGDGRARAVRDRSKDSTGVP